MEKFASTTSPRRKTDGSHDRNLYRTLELAVKGLRVHQYWDGRTVCVQSLACSTRHDFLPNVSTCHPLELRERCRDRRLARKGPPETNGVGVWT